MNITLTKQGRYTYITLDGKSIKCASAAAAKKLKEVIEGCAAMTPAQTQPAGMTLAELAKAANVPEFEDWPDFVQWNKDRTDRLVMYGDDLTTP